MTVAFDPRGAWTALVTPFNEQGELDLDGFEKLVAFQLDQGIDGLVPCGTTGESPTLSWDDHDALVEACVRFADGKVGVLAGTGSNSTTEAIKGTEDARRLGASAALVVDCYYNGPSSLELREEYYQRVLDEVPDIPIVPYIIPGRSGCALSAADLAMLHHAAPERVVAVKQATGDFERMREDRRLAGRSLAILSGDDPITTKMMGDEEIGASGVISVISNIAPAVLRRAVAAAARGDAEAARAAEDSVRPLMSLVGVNVRAERDLDDGRVAEVTDRFRNPVPVKTMMSGLGMVGRRFRRPLGLMSKAGVAVVRDALKAVHDADPSVLAPIGEFYEVDIAARLADDAIWSQLTR